MIFFLAIPCLAQVEATFFGMLVNKTTSFPVTVPITSIRLLGRGVAWNQLCPAVTNCQWRRLDDNLAAIKKDGISDVLYTNMKTPLAISSNPTGHCWAGPIGDCYPPRDLNSDGSGTDNAWKGFIQALADHNRRLDPAVYAKIKFWGIWNEPTAGIFWQGTDAQMVRMAKDAYAIIKAADPSALVLTPEPAASSKHGAVNNSGKWLDHYLSAGGGQYADVIAFHTGPNAVGPNTHPVVEDVVAMVTSVKDAVARHPEVSGKPLWMTEGNWGDSDEANWNGFDQAAAFVVRYYVLLAWQGMQRVYWFEWDGNPEACCGALWTREKGELPTAVAYREVHKWLLGRTVSGCSAQAHVWSCDLTGPGYKGKIVWDDDYEKTASYNPAGFASARDISGGVTHLDQKAPVITVGNKPILLEAPGSSRP